MSNYNRASLSLLALLSSKVKLVPGLHPVCKSIFKTGNSVVDLLRAVVIAQKSPIYITGLPRSGTTWIASVINTAHSIKYLHEPFNCKNVSGASKYCMKYLTTD